MKRFGIVLHLEDGTRELAGALAIGDSSGSGHYDAEFRYDGSWLKSKKRFALDPE